MCFHTPAHKAALSANVGSPVTFHANGKQITGNAAELHYLQWCLALEQEHKDVPHCALDAVTDFQRGAFRGDAKAAARIEQSGLRIERAKPRLPELERRLSGLFRPV